MRFDLLRKDAPRIKGADISSLPEVEEAGGRFYDEASGIRRQASGDAAFGDASHAFPLGGSCHRASPASPMTDEGSPRAEDPLSHAFPPGGRCHRAAPASPMTDEGSLRAEDPLSHAFPLGGRCHRASPASPMTDEGSLQAEDPLVILRRHGCNLIRLRLWNDPYAEDGAPYGAGTNDLPRTMALARRCKALGLPWLLDLHYSDFWADPGKQYPPKAWAGLDPEGLTEAVYAFTKDTLAALRDADLLPAICAVGNEVSNGVLWPLGRVPHWENLTRFLSAGIRAVRETDPAIPVMLHLDNGCKREMCRDWFEQWFAHGGADFDCIGLSFYPFWHGTLEQLRDNLRALAERWGKPLVVAETSCAFTLEPCADPERIAAGEVRPLAANPRTAAGVPYPMTPAGQAQFLEDVWAAVRSVPDDLGRGLIWWEPGWLPVPGAGWSQPAGLAYIHETGGGNEWANQGLFDYEGKALPALRTLESLK